MRRYAATKEVFVVRLVTVLAVLACGGRPAVAMTVDSVLPLETITAESGRIVHGAVSETRTGRDESGIPSTWVTLRVDRTLKGERSARITIKQFGAANAGSDGALGLVPGMPQYTTGEEVVLFLRQASPRGFTSPVGLEQGVYRVRGSPGRRSVRSGDGADEKLDAFLDHVERLVANPSGR